jgi:hypothetical protein
MAENTQPSSTDQPEDPAVLALQELEGTDASAEVEAHNSSYSVAVCGSAAD